MALLCTSGHVRKHWAIHRGLKLIVDALGDYLKEPARTSR